MFLLLLGPGDLTLVQVGGRHGLLLVVGWSGVAVAVKLKAEILSA